MNVEPLPANPQEALAALEEDLPVVLHGRALGDVEWLRPDPLTLVVPLAAIAQGGAQDLYFLRLNFGYYREWPPSALFVNPRTLRYVKGEDAGWLPRIEGTSEIQVHADYTGGGQLVCCSSTLEFYQVRHGVEAKHVWDPKAQNFASTLNAVRRALRSEHYKGRQA